MRSIIICILTQYCSGDNTRRIKWAGNIARMGEGIGVNMVFVEKPEGKNTTWKTQAQMGG
jgi:hypothetical protein